jgi:hypothetical protein
MKQLFARESRVLRLFDPTEFIISGFVLNDRLQPQLVFVIEIDAADAMRPMQHPLIDLRMLTFFRRFFLFLLGRRSAKEWFGLESS